MTTNRRSTMLAMFVAAGIFWGSGATLQAQDSLTRAKAFYASAAYEDALQVLGGLGGNISATEATEAAAYQVFCLVALGRAEEAKHASEAIVRSNPLYRPSADQVSPRIRTFFEDVRRPLLPEVTRNSYAKAKDAFDRKDMATAKSDFDRVIALTDELAAGGDNGTGDLRTLATGFRELAVVALTPPPPPPPPPVVEAKPEPEPLKAVEPERIYGVADTSVLRPAAVSRPMPTWRPGTPAEAQLPNRGTIELLIDEAGRVLSATIVESVNPRFDPLLLRAAANWTFTAATKDGQPVKYRYRIGIQLNR